MSRLVIHKKSGEKCEYIGTGIMQSNDWYEDNAGWDPVDMREVAVYKSLTDGSLWVRPLEEFNDGRFEEMSNI